MVESLDNLVRTIDRDEPPVFDGIAPSLRALVGALIAGPAPRDALINLRNVVAAVDGDLPIDTDAARETIARVLASGPDLTRMIIRRPDRLALLNDSTLGRSWRSAELAAALDDRLADIDAADLDAAAEVISGFRNDHFLRLAACEFGDTSLEQVGTELSNLADVCLDRALVLATAATARRGGAPCHPVDGALQPGALAAIAMGKYGAQELNFCSDIDVVFIYRSDEGEAGERTVHEAYAAVARAVVKMLSEINAEGFAFRVDLRLRPEGSRGPVCNSLDAAEAYYETWGGPLDRLAWLKARAAAGDLALGRAMVDLMRPFVFPRGADPSIIGALRDLTQRIRAELHGKSVATGWNVKLGEGGIRDVEFFAQALQLLHGGRRPTLRARGTLRALDRLLFAGMISERERQTLAEAYDLYRRLEHRLQLHGGRQTHLLPDEGPLRAHVIAHLGFRADAFERELDRRRREVAAIYATLAPVDDGRTPELALRLPDDATRDDVLARLTAAGFADPTRALELMLELGERPFGPFGSKPSGAARRVRAPLLSELASAPDPDAALLMITQLCLRFGRYDGLWGMLADHPIARRILVSLLGTSEYLARLLVNHPELLDTILFAGRLPAERASDDLDQKLDAAIGGADTFEGKLNAARRFRREEVLRLALHDINGSLDLAAVWRQLSAVAEAIIARLYPLVLAEAERRYGRACHTDGSPASLCIIGLGKLGGRELSYGSDLDLIFVYSGPGRTDGERSVDNAEFFARVSQRFIRAMSADLADGRLYEVDTRLRPSGRQGALVTSRAGLEAYHARGAELWERQVLVKARVVGGDVDIGRAVSDWIDGYAFGPPPDGAALRGEMTRLRRRVQNERAGETKGRRNLKVGRGGLMDIEACAQYLQLMHGHATTALRRPATLDALAAAAAAELLGRDDANALEDAYRFLRRLEGRLSLVRGGGSGVLPTDPAGLEVIARRSGYRRQADRTAGEQLIRDYERWTDNVRALHSRLVGEV